VRFATLFLVPLIVVVLHAGQAPAVKPVPRFADGTVNLGSTPNEIGLWVPPNAGDERLVELDDPNTPDPFAINSNPLQRTPRFENATTPTQFKGKITESRVPFQPWARALYDQHQVNQWEPHTRCKPSGGPRALLTPYGVEFLQKPEEKALYIIDIGGPHSMRVIPMDGRPHPKDLVPSYLGHSSGHWEKDTLVVDTIGFNERFWYDRHGLPHTENLHTVERFSRPDFNTLMYELTVDDPGAYTATWSTALLLRWNNAAEVFEYVCQDNNHFPELMDQQPDAGSLHHVAP
jgi:hypothetical protein